MRAFVVGSNGNLGRTISQALDRFDLEVCSLTRSEYMNWDVKDSCHHFFESERVGPGDKVYVCAGISNPGEDSELISKVNVEIPKSILTSASNLGFEVVTFGTTLESQTQMNNAYIASKRLLAREVLEVNASVMHLRLQTLYGVGQPKTHMFLGQMFEAIKHKTPFKMTSGLQVREYHHLLDLVEVVLSTDFSGSPRGRVLELRSGDDIQLRNLAKGIFSAFGQDNNLIIAAHKPDENEVYTRMAIDPSQLLKVSSRETLQGVQGYFEQLLENDKDLT